MTDSSAKRIKEGDNLPIIRVAGVPEHFNYSWKIGCEERIFEQNGVKVEFQEIKEGTGAMIKALKDEEADVIVALTEGLVADIAKGSDLQLLGTYVGSPLCWAISSGANSAIQNINDLEGKCFGISRFGSGSHLMALVLATQRGWKNAPTFKVVGNFQNLRDSVNAGETDAFMWETFTTKPFHDSGEIRRIGDITTPWPCFMLAARKPILQAKAASIQAMLSGIHQSALLFHARGDTMPATIADLYGLKLKDAKAWYSQVQISAERYVAETALERAVEALKEGGVLPQDISVPLESLVAPGFGQIRKDIKSMRLYRKPELMTALYRTLKHHNMAAGPLSYKELSRYDHNIYYGVTAVDELIEKAKIINTHRVVNIGSGMGGPARYLAGKTGCQVLACELQQDLHNTACELTARVGLENLVHHICGDFLQLSQHLQSNAYDHVVSWLTLLHFPERSTAFRRSYDMLRPGGVFFAADFVQKGHLSEDEWEVLKEDVGCLSLAASEQVYSNELEAAGFKIVASKDVTNKWKAYTAQRVAEFEKNKESMVQIIGEEIYEGLYHFYSLVKTLFQNGNLGGIEVYAQKPLGW